TSGRGDSQGSFPDRPCNPGPATMTSTPNELDTASRLAAAAVELARSRQAVPVATYRLQMHAGFTFRDAERILPYLHSLGISHLYLSPVLKARPGSSHGYDTLDPTSLNPEIGTEEDFQSLVAS